MKLSAIHLYVIKMPLKSPFLTHLGAVTDREGIIIEVRDEDGVSGFGEGVAFRPLGTQRRQLKQAYIC